MSKSKTEVLITMVGGFKVTTTVYNILHLLDLTKLDYKKPFVLAQDENGITIMVNLNHVLSIQYTKTKQEN